MTDLLEAADEVYSASLQILNHYRIEPWGVPLVMASASQRIEQFSIGAMARELSEARRELEELKEQDTEGVDDGRHID